MAANEPLSDVVEWINVYCPGDERSTLIEAVHGAEAEEGGAIQAADFWRTLAESLVAKGYIDIAREAIRRWQMASPPDHPVQLLLGGGKTDAPARPRLQTAPQPAPKPARPPEPEPAPEPPARAAEPAPKPAPIRRDTPMFWESGDAPPAPKRAREPLRRPEGEEPAQDAEQLAERLLAAAEGRPRPSPASGGAPGSPREAAERLLEASTRLRANPGESPREAAERLYEAAAQRERSDQPKGPLPAAGMVHSPAAPGTARPIPPIARREDPNTRIVRVIDTTYTFKRLDPQMEKVGDKKVTAGWETLLDADDDTSRAVLNQLEDGTYAPWAVAGVATSFAGAAAVEVVVRSMQRHLFFTVRSHEKTRNILAGLALPGALVVGVLVGYLMGVLK